jgi:hypothetical protein
MQFSQGTHEMLIRKTAILQLLLLIIVAFLPHKAVAQTISVKMDVRTLNSLLYKYGQTSYHLSGPFTARNLKMSKIKNGVVYGTFDLEFDGTITIPIPFIGRKKVGFTKNFSMKMNFSPIIDKGILIIPVKTISVSGSGMSLSLSSKALGAMVNFKRWLFSSGGKSLLKRKFSINFKYYLNKYIAKKKWKVKLDMGLNHLAVTGYCFVQTPTTKK